MLNFAGLVAADTSFRLAFGGRSHLCLSSASRMSVALKHSVHALEHHRQHGTATLDYECCMSRELSRPVEFSLLFKWEAECHLEPPSRRVSAWHLYGKALVALEPCHCSSPDREGCFCFIRVVFVTSMRSGPGAFLSVFLLFLEASGPADLGCRALVGAGISSGNSNFQNSLCQLRLIHRTEKAKSCLWLVSFHKLLLAG